MNWGLGKLEASESSPTHPHSSCLPISVLCCSVAQSYPTLCSPRDCSTSGFLVLHHLPEFSPFHVHGVNDAVQPSHPLLPPSPPHAHMHFGNWDLEFLSPLHAPPPHPPAPLVETSHYIQGLTALPMASSGITGSLLLLSPVKTGCCQRGF